MTRVRVVVAAAVAVVALGLVAVLSESKTRLAGTNTVDPQRTVARVDPGQEVCQGPDLVYADTAQVVLRTPRGLDYRGPVEVTLRQGDRVVSTGRRFGGPRDGRLIVPVRRLRESFGDVTVCLRAQGPGTLRLQGFPIGPPQAAEVDGRPAQGKLALEYLRDGRESWWQLAGTVAHRFGIGKAAFLGDWTLWAALLLMAGAWAGALRLVLREGRS